MYITAVFYCTQLIGNCTCKYIKKQKILHETSHRVLLQKHNNEPLKFPLEVRINRQVNVPQRPSWVQQTTICHSLGFDAALLSRIVCLFHKGSVFFSTLQNQFITPLCSQNVPVIRATIAGSGAILVSRFTSYFAFETFSFISNWAFFLILHWQK